MQRQNRKNRRKRTIKTKMKHKISKTEPFKSAKLGTWWTNGIYIAQLRRLVHPQNLTGKLYLLNEHPSKRTVTFVITHPSDWKQVNPPKGRTGYSINDEKDRT